MPSLPAHILYLGQPKDPLIERNPPPTKHRLAAKMLHGRFFSVLMTVTASAIFVREVAKKGQEMDCHSALAILQKEPRSEGCAGGLREGR